MYFFSWTTKFYIVLKAVYSPYVEVLYCSISGEALPVIEKEYQPKTQKQNNELLSLLLREAFVCVLVTINARKHNSGQSAENK